MKCVSAFVLLIFSWPFFAAAQFKELPTTTENSPTAKLDYLYPVTPGTINTLAGTMGELRNTHFHSGIDVRTNNQIGAAVLAAQDGYVSRIVKSSYSYGNVIFITHPDSNTTLYAHLNSFKGNLADHVRQQQYQRMTFEIDLRFGPTEFPVHKGDTVAWSGNTGSSNGPHVHFDIRDKDMNALNPLKFGFEEIPDKTEPLIQKIALRTMDIHSRINGNFGRFEFHVLKVGTEYVLRQPILAIGKIGVEILAYDRMDNSRFQCGINTIEMRADSQRVFLQQIDKITMGVTRGILSLMDYSTMESSGYRFNKLFIGDGNPLNFYDGTVDNGIISVDNKDIPVQIKLKDTYGNSSTVSFKIKHDHEGSITPIIPNVNKPQGYSISENTLQFSTPSCSEKTSTVYSDGNVFEINPAYQNNLSRVFLLDLKKAIPDSIKSCRKTIAPDIKYVVPSQTEFTYFSDDLSVIFPDSALFDTLYFTFFKKGDLKNESITIGDRSVPLMREIKVQWKPRFSYDSKKYNVYRVNGGYVNLAGKWEGDKISFASNKFGEFKILADTIPPSILKIACNQTYARFKIHDNLSGIYSFEASINGKWILMNYDYKTGILYSEKIDNKLLFKGDFQLKVTDFMGNEKIYKQKIQ